MMGRNNILRIILIVALFFVGMQLMQQWTAWEKSSESASHVVGAHANNAVVSKAGVPVLNTQSANQTNAQNKTAVLPNAANAVQQNPHLTPDNRTISVSTDLLHVRIDRLGGNIVQSQLLQFPQTLNSTQPFTLLNDNPDTLYLAQTGLTGKQGPDTALQLALYASDKTQYKLSPDQKTLQVDLQWVGSNGVSVTKSYIFKRGQYGIDVRYRIHNQGSAPWQGQLYTQLQHKPQQTKQTLLGLHTFTGAAISSNDKKYEKISYKSLDKHNLNRPIQGGWLAFQQHYFLNAWVNESDQTNHYYSQVSDDNVYTLGAIGPVVVVPPHTVLEKSVRLYTGPESTKALEKVAPNLDLTIDYGIFWVISSTLFWFLHKIHFIVGNWGWSIVLLTLLVRLVFYKLSVISYRSMGKMRLLQPKIQQLKERYGDDKPKFSQEIMALYRKEKANPLSGCLPMLIQIPVFIGLYWVLIESVELRQAPWILWIHDLAARDPYFILPICMGLTMFLQQKLSPPPPDPMQAKVMMMLPVVFTALFLYFPAGLVLYWVTNNTISITQQWYIMRKLEKEHKGGSKKRKLTHKS